MVRSCFRLFMSFAVLTILVACSATDKLFDDLTGKDKFSFECPDVQIIEDGKEITQFRPGVGRDVIDIEFEAKFDTVTAECSFNRDNYYITMIISYTIEANQGPAATTNTFEIPYLVAVVTRDQEILVRSSFDTVATFTLGKRRVRFTDEIEQITPVSDPSEGAQYEILTSFLLDKDQLLYNREKRLR